jgi:hypothetical protein
MMSTSPYLGQEFSFAIQNAGHVPQPVGTCATSITASIERSHLSSPTLKLVFDLSLIERRSFAPLGLGWASTPQLTVFGEGCEVPGIKWRCFASFSLTYLRSSISVPLEDKDKGRRRSSVCAGVAYDTAP